MQRKESRLRKKQPAAEMSRPAVLIGSQVLIGYEVYFWEAELNASSTLVTGCGFEAN